MKRTTRLALVAGRFIAIRAEINSSMPLLQELMRNLNFLCAVGFVRWRLLLLGSAGGRRRTPRLTEA